MDGRADKTRQLVSKETVITAIKEFLGTLKVSAIN